MLNINIAPAPLAPLTGLMLLALNLLSGKPVDVAFPEFLCKGM